MNIEKYPVKKFGSQGQQKSYVIALKLAEDDMLEWVRPSTGKDDIMLATSLGQAIRFKESGVRPMGRTAKGDPRRQLRAFSVLLGLRGQHLR